MFGIDLDILWAQAQPIPVHAVFAMLALVLGAVQVFGPKGTTVHRILGYAWVALMASVAVTAIFISEIRLIGPFSPIHLLIPLVLYSLWHAVRAARRGDVAAHKKGMVALFIYALVITGAFTLLPGRAIIRSSLVAADDAQSRA